MIDIRDRLPLIGGVATAAACLAGTIGLGTPGDWEALQRLEAIQPTLRFLASTVITAAATILALMLTLLGLSSSSQRKLKEVYGMLGAASLFAGCLAVIVFMLYSTISDMVEVLGLGRDDHPMVYTEEEGEEEA